MQKIREEIFKWHAICVWIVVCTRIFVFEKKNFSIFHGLQNGTNYRASIGEHFTPLQAKPFSSNSVFQQDDASIRISKRSLRIDLVAILSI